MRERLVWLVMAVAAGGPVFGSTIELGDASSFALLGSTITETGDSNIVGNVGATTTITQNGAWTVTGTVYPAPSNPTVTAAYDAFESAYDTGIALGNTQPTLTSLPATQTFTGNNVYRFTNNISTATGTVLTFDDQGNPNEIFVIQVDGAFTVNGILTFDLGSTKASNIFWIVEDAATISVGSSPAQTFDGNILAGTSFTMSAASGGSGTLAGTINGCVFSETANALAGQTNVNGCVTSAASNVPEPGSSELVSLGCLLGILAWRKLRVRL